MSYLLDTCVISKLRKISKKPDKKLENWLQKHSESEYYISALTMGEIQSGISKLNLKKNDEKRKRIILEDWFQEELIPRFRDRILGIDNKISLEWGRITGEGKQRGVIIPSIDGLIAATGIVHNFTVVTENVKDFIDTGVRVYSPWIN